MAPSPDSDANTAAVDAAPPPANDLAAIVATLEEDIVFGRLHPRERLVEDELIERFGAKRHVVREALATLDRMGLLERRKNIGALVRHFSAQEVAQLYALRELLETEAARQIPLPVPAEQLQALVAVQQQHDAAVDSQDPRRVFRANLLFHRALFALTGNAVLQQAITEYARQTHPIRFASLVSPEYRERARAEHWQMIEALQRADRTTLVRLCAAHLPPSRDAYLAANQLRFGA
ncbi:GntR family transcriptional regulator [Pseudorhodoferax soli]|uniref:GntR family transcriptional regulator n=1 Tax=Pseudorhodoferax soli TaxID=545864 RepID=A0A368XUR1_9BURK|nr:GntR family transcriptional regulator [Pseudorhodoferax soli]RCW71692.1 GntR family transcriptional regulator [Pseudorhodoferax soli]